MNIMNPSAPAKLAAYENALVRVRRFALLSEEILHEGGPRPEKPMRRAAAMAVVHNPYAGRYEPDILPMMEALKPLGIELSRRLLATLGGDPKAIETYGKGAIVGQDGELEHGALWHAPGGYSMREVLGGAKAIVPSTHKVGAMGSTLDVPLHHLNASYVRSHFDTITIGIADAPRPDEILFVLTMGCGSRVHERVGGFRVSEISLGDGQR